MKQLIINSDDFGACHSINEGGHFVCSHLAARSSEMRAVSSTGSPWAEDYRATDLDAILAPSLRGLCDERGIQLISLKDYPGRRLCSLRTAFR